MEINIKNMKTDKFGRVASEQADEKTTGLKKLSL